MQSAQYVDCSGRSISYYSQRSPTKPSDARPLTFLLLQLAKSVGVEGSYELAAYINDEATTAEGIEQTLIVLFLLQERKDKSVARILHS